MVAPVLTDLDVGQLLDVVKVSQVQALQALRVVVVGGSIGGLAAAIALQRLGCKVIVCERGQLDQREGGGIMVQPDALAFLAQYAEIRPEDIGHVARRRVLYDARGAVSETESCQGMLLSCWDMVWRALRRQVPDYHSNCRVCRVEAKLGPVEVVTERPACTSEGRLQQGKLQADLIVAADGAGSQLRGSFLQIMPVEQMSAPSCVTPVGLRESRYAGYVGWRGWMYHKDVPATVTDLASDAFSVCRVPTSHIILYSIPSTAFPGQQRINWVWYVNHDKESLSDWMVDREGVYRPYSIARGQLSLAVEDQLKQLAKQMLPPNFAEVVTCTQHIFAQGIYDLSVTPVIFTIAQQTTASTASNCQPYSSTHEACAPHQQQEEANITQHDASVSAGLRHTTNFRREDDSKSPGIVFGAPSMSMNNTVAIQPKHYNACLLGDAAFVIRPHTAAGTSKATLNAWQLATALYTAAVGLGHDVVNDDDECKRLLLKAALVQYNTAAVCLGQQLMQLGIELGDTMQFHDSHS